MRLPRPRVFGPRRAAASVELAVLLPFLFFLFVVAVDYCRIFYYAVTLENCSRNGAYYASEYPNSSYIYNEIYGYKNLDDAVLRDASNITSPGNPSSNPQYTIGYGTSPNGPFTSTTESPDCYVQVTVTWTFNSITKFPGVPTQVNLSRSTVMRVAPAMPTFPK
jgi:Flp pilus assembly protein TadG